MILCIGFIAWIFASRDGHELFEFLVSGGAGVFFPLSIVVGFVIGLVGRTEASSEISQYLATRPIPNADLARVVLRTSAKSVLLAWSIWIIAVIFVYATVTASDSASDLQLPNDFRWWFFPGILLASWTVVGIGATIGLAGRGALFFKSLCVGLLAILAYVLLEKFALSWQVSRRLDELAVILWGTALFAFAGWAFTTARRRGLISSSTIWASATVWLLLVCAVIYLAPSGELDRFRMESYWALIGTFSLVVLPLAAAPLAVAWNRHR
jgi:hypothetical protein